MLIEYEDFNGADSFLRRKYSSEWVDIHDVLTAMPLHLKASDQAGIQGSPIFDPIGTNAFIKEALRMRGWSSNLPIPSEFSFLGISVDHTKRGLLMEAQFSNYPFLLNNVVRSELFSKSGVSLDGDPIEVVVILTKAHMFPASNSTLYYQQAVKQLRELAKHNVFDVPMRVVGLKERIGPGVNACWTEYRTSRYSRTVVSQTKCSCDIELGRTSHSRCRLTIVR